MAWTKSVSDSSQRPSDETRASLRRSTASAKAPPYRPNAINGKSANSPTSPTENVDPVRAYTWMAIATAVICWPSWETVLPNHSRR